MSTETTSKISRGSIENEIIEIRKAVKAAIEADGMFYAKYAGFNYDCNEMRQCPFEYCIETQPLLEEDTDYDCPIFGHLCPGGLRQTSLCRK